jgi:predicted metal-binding protein
MEGASLMKIYCELYNINNFDKYKFVRHSTRLGRILRKYQYTGYQLTIEGFDIYKRFINNEIDSLKILLDKNKYWVKSVHYPVELISIEDWVKLVERLQIPTIKLKNSRKDRLLRASKDIATGLIQCGDCGARYYYKEQKAGKYITGEPKIYYSYCHFPKMNGYICKQKPKSFKLDNINELFKIFYFYSRLVFDDTTELVKESLRNIKQVQAKLKELVTKSEKEISVIEKRLTKFRNALDNLPDEPDVIRVLSKQIDTNETRLTELNNQYSKLKIDYEIQNEKFNQTEREMTYYDVKEKILDWFYRLNIEDQRNELIRIIKACKIINHHLIIDTGKVVFIFDIFKKDVFDMKLLDNLNKDEVYKEHFIELKHKREARKLNNKLIHNVNLNRDKEIRMRVFQYLAKTYNIIYDISEHTNLISFVHLTGIMSLEIENFDNK